MSVYVDPVQRCQPNARWRFDRVSHLFADYRIELDSFARRVGLRPEWIQTSSRGVVHFDLTPAYRRVAIAHGAIELDRMATVEKLRQILRRKAA